MTNDAYKTGPAVWDKIAGLTGVDRTTCKALIFAMIYGTAVVHVCRTYKLSIDRIVEIRCAFNDIMEGRIEL